MVIGPRIVPGIKGMPNSDEHIDLATDRNAWINMLGPWS
jgi:hypothetical protein